MMKICLSTRETGTRERGTVASASKSDFDCVTLDVVIAKSIVLIVNMYFMLLNWSIGFKCHIPKTAHVASASKRGFYCVPNGDKMCHNMCITCVTVMLILSWQYVLYREERNCLNSSHVPANLILIVSIAVIGDKMYHDLLIACVTTFCLCYTTVLLLCYY